MSHFKFSFFLVFVILCFSCKENYPVQEDDFYNVKVLGINSDCKEILVEFIDTTSLPEFLKKDRLGTYPRFNALNLHDSFNIRDLILKIKFREPLKEEEHPCLRMWPPYRFIFILSANREE